MKRKLSLILIAIILLVFTFTTMIFATDVTNLEEIENAIIEENYLDNDYEDYEDYDDYDDYDDYEDYENYDDYDDYEDYDIKESDIFEFHEDDYEMNDLIDGNAFIMVNGDLKIEGEINGSTYVVANGTVEIGEEAYIADALYVIAKNVIISGYAYDVYAMTNNLETTSTAYIYRDLNALTSNKAKLRGSIYRNVNINSQNIDVKDEEDELNIAGNFNYTSENEIEEIEDVVLNGQVNYTQSVKYEFSEPTAGEVIKKYAVNALTSIIYVLSVFYLIKLIAPRFKEKIEKDLKEKSIVDFTVGLLGFIILIIAIIITIVLLFTEIAIPISIIAWIIMLFALYISPAVLQMGILGLIEQKYEKIRDNIGFEVLTLIGVSLCIWILQQIPILGRIISFIVVSTGFGLIIRNIFTREKVEKVEKVEE